MTRIAVETASAPAAIGPYSQAIRAGELLFCSGQIPLDPVTGELVSGDIDAEIARVLDNLAAVLEAAGAGFGDVVKFTVFLTDLGDFARVNAHMQERLVAPYPARAAVGVASLPRGARVEMEAIARIP